MGALDIEVVGNLEAVDIGSLFQNVGCSTPKKGPGLDKVSLKVNPRIAAVGHVATLLSKDKSRGQKFFLPLADVFFLSPHDDNESLPFVPK